MELEPWDQSLLPYSSEHSDLDRERLRRAIRGPTAVAVDARLWTLGRRSRFRGTEATFAARRRFL